MIDYEKTALKILHHASEGEYDSDLAGSDYFNWKKGFFQKREVILEDYAKQVCYRHEFKKMAKMLEDYINNYVGDKVGCKLTEAQAIIGISKKVEKICKEHKDEAKMNEVLEDLVFAIYPYVEVENNKVKHVVAFKEEDYAAIKKGIAYLNQLELKEEKELD